MNPRIPHLKWRRAPQLSSESEVAITLRCQLCSTRYTAFRIKNCSESTSAIHAYRKKKNWCRVSQLCQHGRPAYFDVSIRCTTQPAFISSCASCAGVAAAAGEVAKDKKHLAAVEKVGSDFIPLPLLAAVSLGKLLERTCYNNCLCNCGPTMLR